MKFSLAFSIYLKVIFLPVTLILACNRSDSFKYLEGDLLFQDGDCGEFCEAIETVTAGIHGLRFSHVGIIYDDTPGQELVLEAISAGVVITPLEEFLSRNLDEQGDPRVVIGRLKSQWQPLIQPALTKTNLYLGKPYDQLFHLGDDSFYCSELIYELFKNVGDEEEIFELQPMTFKDPATSKTYPAWTEYYIALKAEIPEGEPGLNPGSMSRSEKIDVFFPYAGP